VPTVLVIREAYASVNGYDEGLQYAPDWAMWLRDWVETHRDFLLWRGRLGATVADWDRTHRDASVLLRGPLLAEARRWQAERAEALSGHEVEFIRASRAAQARRWGFTAGAISVSSRLGVALRPGASAHHARDGGDRARDLPDGRPQGWGGLEN